jgi:hypothetical protein
MVTARLTSEWSTFTASVTVEIFEMNIKHLVLHCTTYTVLLLFPACFLTSIPTASK